MLSQLQLNGKETVNVNNQKMDGTAIFEGKAYIREIHQGDKQGVYAEVEFTEEPDTLYSRWIFASEQS